MLSPFAPATHILTFAQSLHGGGVERAMLRLARGWIAAGHRVTLVLGESAGPLVAEIPDGVELIGLDSSYLGLMRSLPGVVAATAPSVVFCPGNHYTSMAAWLRARLGRHAPPVVAKVSTRLDRIDQRFPVDQAYRRWLRWHPAAPGPTPCPSVAPIRPAVFSNCSTGCSSRASGLRKGGSHGGAQSLYAMLRAPKSSRLRGFA